MASNSGAYGGSQLIQGAFRQLRMRDPILNGLWQYWEKLRAGRLAPYRSEIDPRQFEPALESMFILERVSADNVRFRLAGMKICDIMGMEMRGMPPAALMTQDARAEMDGIIRQVFETPYVADITVHIVGADGREVPAGMLLMPLRSDFGDVTRILGCISTQGDVGAAPQRLKIMSRRMSRIIHDENAADAGPLPGFGEPEQKPFAAPAAPAAKVDGDAAALRSVEGDAPAERQVPTERRRGHLRLVKSDE